MIMRIHAKLMEQLSHGRIRGKWYKHKNESTPKPSPRILQALMIIRDILIYDWLKRQLDPP